MASAQRKTTTNLSTWPIAGIVLVYFAFTSGGIFEVTGSEMTGSLDTPYSIALSAERTGVVGVYNDDDVACAQWLAYEANPEVPIVGGYNGRLLVASFVSPVPRLKDAIHVAPPMFARGIPDHCYVFFTTWNVEHGQYIESVAPGLRQAYELPAIEGKVVFKNGKAVVYEVNNE